MSKQWYRQCQTGLCFNGGATTWCESFYPDGCQGGDVGDFDILEKSSEQIEASPTKFYGQRDKEGNLVLETAGWLAAAGLRKGDVLLGVNHLHYYDEKQRQEILSCAFPEPNLRLAFRYGGGKVEQTQVIANPAYSLPLDQAKEP